MTGYTGEGRETRISRIQQDIEASMASDAPDFALPFAPGKSGGGVRGVEPFDDELGAQVRAFMGRRGDGNVPKAEAEGKPRAAIPDLPDDALADMHAGIDGIIADRYAGRSTGPGPVPAVEGAPDDRVAAASGGRPPVALSIFEEMRRVAESLVLPRWGIGSEALVAWSERERGVDRDADDHARRAAWIARRYGTGDPLEWPSDGEPAPNGPDPEGREAASGMLWLHRERLRAERADDVLRDGYARGLPWIAARVQMAANTGLSASEADASVERLARMDGLDVPGMYLAVSRATGLAMESVDIVLWTALGYGPEIPE